MLQILSRLSKELINIVFFFSSTKYLQQFYLFTSITRGFKLHVEYHCNNSHKWNSYACCVTCVLPSINYCGSNGQYSYSKYRNPVKSAQQCTIAMIDSLCCKIPIIYFFILKTLKSKYTKSFIMNIQPFYSNQFANILCPFLSKFYLFLNMQKICNFIV